MGRRGVFFFIFYMKMSFFYILYDGNDVAAMITAITEQHGVLWTTFSSPLPHYMHCSIKQIFFAMIGAVYAILLHYRWFTKLLSFSFTKFTRINRIARFSTMFSWSTNDNYGKSLIPLSLLGNTLHLVVQSQQSFSLITSGRHIRRHIGFWKGLKKPKKKKADGQNDY